MRSVPVLALVLAAALAGCGGGGGGDEGSTGASSSAPCPKGAEVVRMRDIAFVPETARVKVGQRVCWVNDDQAQHDARAEDGQFASELFGKGQTYTTTLRRAGTIGYVCTVHPGMTGTLRVSP